ncbi:MAG: cysteine--tRNA ligase [Acidimicrobiia bacterium]|nr:cysteine--tRNA ligase [Acidimicrobiia bacterium]
MDVFNTLGRRRQPFQPLQPGRVGIYVCGPTVQARPHVGHGRAAVAFDVVRRYLTWSGYEVVYVQNVTDIEDKIIAAAAAEGADPQVLAKRNAEVFAAAYLRLGVRAPDIEPAATDHIAEMVQLIATLIAAGHAYPAGGDVYYAVRSYDGYGKLSGRRLDDLIAGPRIEPGEHKRDPLDFALWKAAKAGEPSWDSPWGPGRPGWHIECSAMARLYLGHTFDIHAGGADLIFPHHENEIAQSEAATGTPLARYWLHNGMVNLGGEKMAKSTGHVVDLIEALDTYPPQAVRLFYLRTHYRKPLDFTTAALEDSTASLDRLWAFRRRAGDPGSSPAHPATIAAFRSAMDDDFDAAGGLGVLFEAVRIGNRLLDADEDASALVAAYDELADLLGLSEVRGGIDDLAEELGALGARFGVSADAPETVLAGLLAIRAGARDRQDWATADAVRAALADLGLVVEDGTDGPRWHRS